MDHVLAWLMGLVAILPGFGPAAPPSWNGYAEDDYVYAAAASAGTIASMPVAEGQLVHKGDVLFVLETSQQQAQYDAARARADAAEATLANLKTGSRQEEIDVTKAQLMKAGADLSLAQQNLARTQDLFDRGLTPVATLDQGKASVKAAQAAVDQLTAQLKVQQLPARDAQQIAAEANVAAAKADAATARAALETRTVTAPADGRVERLYYKAGEVVAVGAPVAALSGAGTMKVLFYVSEADRQQFTLGQQVAVSCDGCAAGLTASISRFASDPQFTPPIIFSRDERSRLSFLTEAVMDQQNAVLPGQPVSIGRLK
ncbi:MAG TPA: HlyD family efflux transporter periplasmic adaptor subunit [Devosia sp.]|nr:HlyD family efflux transporter periplasmic adaptor subunit [Devosia sp.]